MNQQVGQSTPKSPKGWDLCRFIKTLAYFGVIPVLSSFNWFQNLLNSSANPRADQQAIAYGQQTSQIQSDDFSSNVMSQTTPMKSGEVPPSTRMIFDFQQSNNNYDEIWGAVDDVVMGGVSQSSLVATEQGALFSGVVSTENSGGFASVRTRNFEPSFDLENYTGIQLRVQGDGKRYKFILRDETRWDGVGYSYSFDTVADTWITVQIPFNEVIPVFRARTLTNGQRINPSHLYAFQMMLSKFEYDGALNQTFEPGTFQLLIESISAYCAH